MLSIKGEPPVAVVKPVRLRSVADCVQLTRDRVESELTACRRHTETCWFARTSTPVSILHVATQFKRMPTVEYISADFSGVFAPVNGTNNLDVSWPFLVWSAISVGRTELLHLVQYGECSLLEMVYRAAILFANLRDDGCGQVRRSEAYLGLDPSESRTFLD